MSTVVVGAGAVGMGCAVELARRGEEVVVLDAGRVGSGASWGNPGWIMPSHTASMNQPSLVVRGVQEVFGADSVLKVNPTLRPSTLHWALAFLRRTTNRRWAAATESLIRLNRRTFDLLDGYRDDGIEFEMYSAGSLSVSRSQDTLDHHRDALNRLIDLGAVLTHRPVSRQELAEAEPLLRPETLAGGLVVPEDRHVHPLGFVEGLHRHLVKQGVDVREGEPVRSISVDGRGVTVHTDRAAFRADRVIVAAGWASGPLLRPFGVKFPVAGAQGHSAIVENPSGGAFRRPVFFMDSDAAVSPYREGTRVASGYEVGLRKPTARPRQISRMLERLDEHFRGWSPSRAPRRGEWSGFRPASADSLPLLGPTPADSRVIAAFGHTTLGVTLAAASADALIPSILDGTTSALLAPFRVDR